MVVNGKACFGEFEFEDFQSYRNRILLQVLKEKLNEKGDLTGADLEDAYQESWVIILQDIENWCLLMKPGDHNLSKCCLTQVRDIQDQKRDALELAHNMKSHIMCRLYDQSSDTRLGIITSLKIVFQQKSQDKMPSDAASTFPGLFQELFEDMNALDELMEGDFFKLKPALERLLRNVGPRIVLKTKKYYGESYLCSSECAFCCWVREPSESDRKNFSELACFEIPHELESFLVLRFRRLFFQELLDFIPFVDRYFTDNRFDN